MIKKFGGQPAQKRMDTRIGMNKLYCCKGSACNNYWSRNLIGHYYFWVISPRNSISFTILVSRREACVGGARDNLSPTCSTPYWNHRYPHTQLFCHAVTQPTLLLNRLVYSQQAVWFLIWPPSTRFIHCPTNNWVSSPKAYTLPWPYMANLERYWTMVEANKTPHGSV